MPAAANPDNFWNLDDPVNTTAPPATDDTRSGPSASFNVFGGYPLQAVVNGRPGGCVGILSLPAQ